MRNCQKISLGVCGFISLVMISATSGCADLAVTGISISAPTKVKVNATNYLNARVTVVNNGPDYIEAKLLLRATADAGASLVITDSEVIFGMLHIGIIQSGQTVVKDISMAATIYETGLKNFTFEAEIIGLTTEGVEWQDPDTSNNKMTVTFSIAGDATPPLIEFLVLEPFDTVLFVDPAVIDFKVTDIETGVRDVTVAFDGKPITVSRTNSTEQSLFGNCPASAIFTGSVGPYLATGMHRVEVTATNEVGHGSYGIVVFTVALEADPKVSIDNFKVIPAFDSINVIDVTIKDLPSQKAITLTIEPENQVNASLLNEKGEEATTIKLETNTLDQPHKIKIKGKKTSSAPMDLTLVATYDKVTKLPEPGQRKFTVFEVELTIVLDTFPKDAVNSAEKALLELYRDSNGTEKLGLITPSNKLVLMGFVVRGKILPNKPAPLQPEDFERAAGKGFRFVQYISSRIWFEGCSMPTKSTIKTPGHELLDWRITGEPAPFEDIRADPITKDGDLFIYFYDAPGFSFGNIVEAAKRLGRDAKDGDVIRERINFLDLVHYKGQRSSADLKYSVRLSGEKKGEEVVVNRKLDDQGDNTLKLEPVNLTQEFTAPDATKEFSLVKIAPTERTGTDALAVTITGKNFNKPPDPCESFAALLKVDPTMKIKIDDKERSVYEFQALLEPVNIRLEKVTFKAADTITAEIPIGLFDKGKYNLVVIIQEHGAVLQQAFEIK